jgi:hypothetical protein
MLVVTSFGVAKITGLQSGMLAGLAGTGIGALIL